MRWLQMVLDTSCKWLTGCMGAAKSRIPEFISGRLALSLILRMVLMFEGHLVMLEQQDCRVIPARQELTVHRGRMVLKVIRVRSGRMGYLRMR